MTTTYPMKCRYNDECGGFANGVALRKHYDEHHPEYVPTTKRGACGECGQELSRASLNGHAKTWHGGRDVQFLTEPPPRSGDKRSSKQGWCTVCCAQVARKNIARHVIDTHDVALQWGEGIKYWVEERPKIGVAVLATSPPADSPLSAEPDPLPQLTVDEVVLPLIEVMALPNGMVPVTAMAALFLWRDQTAVMLNAVSGAGL